MGIEDIEARYRAGDNFGIIFSGARDWRAPMLNLARP
jgi:hypothetical protein